MEPSFFRYGIVNNTTEEASLLDALYRLRYQVYVEEWGFEAANDHPLGLETDIYDARSTHIYAYRGPRENIVGTARIILHSEHGFPIEKHFDIQSSPTDGSRNKFGEISRLSISKAYRRREIDQFIFSGGRVDLDKLEKHDSVATSIGHERRKCEHELIQGIYLLIYRKTLQLGLTHWYAVMARGLQVILKRWGIAFQQIGPEKEYHGLRAPYLLRISTLEHNLLRKNPELLKLAQQKNAGK